MIANKWMKWAVTGALAAAFPAMAMARTHKTASPATAASVSAKHVKTLSVHHHKSHKLSTKRHSASKLHANSRKAKSLHSKSHKASKLHSKKKSAVAM
jgi:hypothetical protein